MELKVGSKIHNRFDIEVRDKETGELKQKGQAKNIILDRMYTRLCNFNSYFSYIHFGQEIGTLDPSRELLFDELGYKSAETEKTVKEFPISKWTRKITLNPEEYVGKSIKEVGISDTYSTTKSKSYINTHALIKDAEGNQLSIEKTDTDVVIIYATVFIELENRSEHIRFDEKPSNPLINYLTGSSSPGSILSIGTFSGDTPYFIGMEMLTKVLTRTININDKKVIYATRLGIAEANNIDISELSLQNIFRCKLVKASVWNDHSFIGKDIGFGDGDTNIFVLNDNKISKMQVYIDGVKTTAYTLENSFDDFPYIHLSQVIEPSEINSDIFGSPYNRTSIGGMETHIFKVSPDKILNEKIFISGSSSSTGNWSMYVYGSYDNIDYVLLGSINQRSAGSFDTEITQPYEYLKFDGGWAGNRIQLIALKGNKSRIVFNTPPSKDAIITADYTVPYIPKSEDYVLDVTCEIQFGEGV